MFGCWAYSLPSLETSSAKRAINEITENDHQEVVKKSKPAICRNPTGQSLCSFLPTLSPGKQDKFYSKTRETTHVFFRRGGSTWQLHPINGTAAACMHLLMETQASGETIRQESRWKKQTTVYKPDPDSSLVLEQMLVSCLIFALRIKYLADFKPVQLFPAWWLHMFFIWKRCRREGLGRKHLPLDQLWLSFFANNFPTHLPNFTFNAENETWNPSQRPLDCSDLNALKEIVTPICH